MKIEEVLEKIEGLNEIKIYTFFQRRKDEVFTSKELVRRLKVSDCALKWHLRQLRLKNKIATFKIGRLTLYGHPDAIQKLREQL